MRLTGKLALVLFFLSADLLLAALAFLYIRERGHLSEQARFDSRSALQRFARVVAETFEPDNDSRRLGYLGMFLGSSPSGHVAEAMLLDAEGRVLLHSDFLKGDYSLRRRPTGELSLQEAVHAKAALERTLEAGGRRFALNSQPVIRGGRRRATVVALYDISVVERDIAAIQRRTLGHLVGVFAAGIAAALATAFLVARALTSPIRALEAATRRIGAGELSYRIPDGRGDELGDLARSFNAMAIQLAALEELKEGFLSRITHDLRNPLSAILGYVELILLGMQGPINDRQRESLDIVVKNGAYLAELINNILDLAKLEAGKMQMLPEAVPLAALVADVLDLARPRALEFKVELAGPPAPCDTQVWADASALKRVLLNLVFNALKFTPPGGRVSVSWDRTAEGDDIVAVRDTGVGIPAAKLGTLFQKFSQVSENQNKARPARGTGLGLVICKEIVEAHGGRIGVESREGQGSVFSFSLPRAGSARALTTAATVAKTAHGD